MYNDAVSDWTQAMSGVHQGSVLRPTLSILYIMDIPEVIKISVDMFTDDTKMHTGPSEMIKIQTLCKEIS